MIVDFLFNLFLIIAYHIAVVLIIFKLSSALFYNMPYIRKHIHAKIIKLYRKNYMFKQADSNHILLLLFTTLTYQTDRLHHLSHYTTLLSPRLFSSLPYFLNMTLLLPPLPSISPLSPTFISTTPTQLNGRSISSTILYHTPIT